MTTFNPGDNEPLNVTPPEEVAEQPAATGEETIPAPAPEGDDVEIEEGPGRDVAIVPEHIKN